MLSIGIILVIILRNFFLLAVVVAAILIILIKFRYQIVQFKLFNIIRKILKIKRKNTDIEPEIGDGYFKTSNEFIGVILIYDIPLDYKDLNDSSLKSSIVSFHKIIQTGDQVDILFRKRYVEQNKFKNSLLNKAQNLRVLIENDPSNTRAKKELDIVSFILDRMSEGEPPFRYEVYLLVHADSRAKAIELSNVILRGLSGLNIGARLAKTDEIKRILFFDKCKCNKISIPSRISFISPFSIPKLPSFEMRNDGIVLGVDMENNTLVSWNFDTLENQHVIVVGPTGSGKTEFLINLGLQLIYFRKIAIVFFDIKGDIKERLKRRNIRFKLLNPISQGISLLNLQGLSSTTRSLQIERILVNSFNLDRIYASALYKAVSSALGDIERNVVSQISWDYVEDKAKEIMDNISFLMISEIIDIVKSLDNGGNLVELIKPGINIIDLTQIKNEVMRRIVIYSIINDIYNKFSKSVDTGLKVGLVIDEAWTVLKSEKVDYPIIADLVKRGRGHGISVFLATQNIEDLGDIRDVYLDNAGLLVAMNNGDKNFWENTVRRLVNVSHEEISNKLAFLGRGEALIRFIGDPRPVIVKLFSMIDSRSS
ncbi:DNA import protein CedB [Candidatus Acidianus copahuensis]|nr:DNA import protein CedB [Candidatus Acidianus copahuensis]